MYKFVVNLIKKYKLEEFIKFVIIGLMATGISYLIYISLIKLMDKSIAYSIGYAISFCFNLIASNLFTFKTKVNVENGIRFGLAHLTNIIIQLILLNLFTFIGIPELYAPIPVYVIAVPVNFFVVRFALKGNKFRK
ncbi:GtrA family protein [Mycoplasmatota bacterium]|nr:GtrA family protein [Mycoplasmatota bacterium]